MEPYLTVKEIAEQLHVEPITVRQYISCGKLKSIKVARKHLITPSDYQEFLDNERGGNI